MRRAGDDGAVRRDEPDECATLIAAAVDAFGGVDALINNAGLAPAMAIEKHTPEIINGVFAANALGPAYLIASVWPHWLKRTPPTAAAPGPVLINVSSMATKDPLPGLFAYAAAKAAVNLMVRSVHNEGRAFGVRAFAVAPGAVETDMLRGILSKEQLPTERTLSPQAVARVIGACIAGERDADSGSVLYLPSP